MLLSLGAASATLNMEAGVVAMLDYDTEVDMASIIQIHGTPTSRAGEIEIEPTTAAVVRMPQAADASELAIYRWRPPRDLAIKMPFDSKLEMIAVSDSTGFKRFVPRYGWTQLLNAREMGLTLLDSRKNLTPQHRSNYRAMFLLFQWLRARRVMLRRNFSSTKDLMVHDAARQVVGCNDILPESLGLDGDGLGERWTIDGFVRRGNEAARNAGYQRPTAQQTIAFGLAEAAKLAPLKLTAQDVSKLVRMALYAQDDEPTPSEEVMDEVFARHAQALEEHQQDLLSDFDAWHRGGHSNLPKSLANGTTDNFGKLDPNVVRRALQEWGWRSYSYLRNCISVTMQFFIESLDGIVTQEEQAFVASVYLPQPVYGDLPLALLMERRSIIQPVVTRLWDEPENTDLQGELHQLLALYAEMADRRRWADRITKQRMSNSVRSEISLELYGDAAHSEPNLPNDHDQRVIQHLLESVATEPEHRCERCGGMMEMQLEGETIEPGKDVLFVARCATHTDTVQPIRLSWENVERICREYVEE